MIVISYDIKDTKLRTAFSKMLMKNGAIRLQMSVYEVRNSQRVLENVKIEIEHRYSQKFDGGDSIVVFETLESKTVKYGNAIHRDSEILYF